MVAGFEVRASGSGGRARLLEDLSHSHGLLTTPLPGTVLALGAAVLAVVVVRRARRSRGGRGSLVAGLAGLVGLGVLSAAAYVNAYAGYLPTFAALEEAVGLRQTSGPAAEPPAAHTAPEAATDAPGSGPSRTTGTVTQVEVPAPTLGIRDGTTYVYTPPGYDPSAARRYPVIYLIPGSPGTPADWFRAGRVDRVMDALVAAHAVRPAIVVAVNTGAGALGDTESLDVVGGPKVESYYTTVVVPYVDAHYRTVPDRRDRVIGGMSSGGFGALNVGLRHLELYSTILAFEPYGDPGRENLRRLLGGDARRFRENSPNPYIRTMAFPLPVNVFLDVGGAAGREVHEVRALADALSQRGQQVEFRIEPGARHTWNEAVVGLPYALSFAAAHLP
ncbi:alpha/beta hydrolase [Georgenia ruanii]|uniref:alpha/beta hydrolase n=1 Tax=Georgenia ruanii TaxID=348442 RepID=UPI00186ACAD3|nr:alpha/beta hydrolase-fold protein [Georgenia ruanii]